MSEWKPIDTVPVDEKIMLGKWYEDDTNGYHGPSCWLWQASGSFVPGSMFIDFSDDGFETKGHHKPTHWRSLDEEPPNE